MLNENIVKKFLTCYQNHDFLRMHDCIDENVKFSDFAFDIHGKEVRAMWHWFCVKYPRFFPSTYPEIVDRMLKQPSAEAMPIIPNRKTATTI